MRRSHRVVMNPDGGTNYSFRGHKLSLQATARHRLDSLGLGLYLMPIGQYVMRTGPNHGR